MHRWTSIEVFNGPFAARQWADTYVDSLVEAAVTAGALDWDMKRTAWGVVFEVEFKNDAEWEKYKNSEAVITALRNTPTPVTGVLIYKGRSLDGGSTSNRKPKPRIGSGSNALTMPIKLAPFLEPLPAYFTDSGVDRRRLTSAS